MRDARAQQGRRGSALDAILSLEAVLNFHIPQLQQLIGLHITVAGPVSPTGHTSLLICALAWLPRVQRRTTGLSTRPAMTEGSEPSMPATTTTTSAARTAGRFCTTLCRPLSMPTSCTTQYRQFGICHPSLVGDIAGTRDCAMLATQHANGDGAEDGGTGMLVIIPVEYTDMKHKLDPPCRTVQSHRACLHLQDRMLRQSLHQAQTCRRKT